MPIIRKLPDLLVNKIAAGEVIERPASIVKELLENALDAGASKIRLTVEDGGRKLIRVSDNGCGISAEDLHLAVTPHATSKIVCEEDLFRIVTMGFRGEALASIGAVSHLQIISKPHDSIEGSRIYVAGEKIQSHGASGSPAGTTVEVRDLFFNVPARRKFLRSANTEFGHIQEQLARIALPNPQVEFELISGTRTHKHLPVCEDMSQRIRDFYGDEISDELLTVGRSERGLDIKGFVAKPAVNRTSGKWQYIFLNGRFIRDRFIQHAIKEAYRGLLEHSRYPVAFLELQLEPDQVDINVHPTKIEVRWQDSNKVYSQVLSTLRETLLHHDLTPALSTKREVPQLTTEQRLQEREKIANFFKQATPSFPTGGAPVGLSPQTSVTMKDLALSFQAGHSAEPTAGPAPQAQPGSSPPAPEPLSAPSAIQLHRTYLVTETEEGMLVIDQHALHERIIYEQLKQRITTGSLESQRLLIPDTVQTTPEQVAVLESNQELLQKVGVEISVYGNDTVAVQSFPALLNISVIQDFMKDLADHLIEKGNHPHTEVLIHSILDMMACKAAIKAGDTLSPEEIRSLIDQKHLVEKNSNCPHGRPTTLKLSLSDLQRQFKRT